MSNPAAAAPTRLTDDELNAIRLTARRAPAFVDPRTLRCVTEHITLARRDWATAMLGRAFGSVRELPWRDVVLLDLARVAEPDPPESPARVAALAAADGERAAAEQRRVDQLTEWHALRDRLPVAVEVVHNYTSARHLAHYVQGGDHIRLREPLHVGRLHRDAGRTLCWTPSRAHNVTHLSDAHGDRVPDCVACLRTAERVAV